MDRYYKIKLRDSDLYFKGDGTWVISSKAKLFTQKSLVFWIAHYQKNTPLDFNLQNIDIVEYDIIESRVLNIDEFAVKYQKSPIIKL